MIEQPVGARAWGTRLKNKLLFVKGVGKVNFDIGMFEMKSAKERGIRLARKRTSIISNPTRHDAGVENHGMPDVPRAKPCARPS